MGYEGSFFSLLTTLTILGDSTFAQYDSNYQMVGLEDHNSYRQLHNAPLMTLDSYLNQRAQECATYYASRRAIDHSCTTSGAGENLYASWGNSGVDPSEVVRTAVRTWYDENSYYNYANPGSSSGVTGHFTQLVWKQSTSLGIGTATVEDYTVVVGKYSPFGNIADADWEYYRANVQ